MSTSYANDKSDYLRFLDTRATGRIGRQEEVRTTPLFTLAVKYAVDYHSGANSHTPHNRDLARNQSQSSSPVNKRLTQSRDIDSRSVSSDSTDDVSSTDSDDSDEDVSSDEEILPEYALLGFHVGTHRDIGGHEPIFMNVNAPNSAFICGSQGSGKSYTLSCMLENCLIEDPQLGDVSSPVAGVVFHYDVDSAGSVAEAAHLCSRGIKVNVLVSPSNEYALRSAYGKIGGKGRSINVQPLRLQSSDLSIERIHKLMAFAEKEGAVPLYMEVAQRILREMAMTSRGAPFDYNRFKALLTAEGLSRDQLSMLNLRLNLLESFLDLPSGGNNNAKSAPTSKAQKQRAPIFQLQPGTLTIVDLSDPFVDAGTVCVLFDICLSIAKERRPPGGLAVALDEAHKFMTRSSPAANNFSDRLLTTIREQRHNATRVFIATQEPTISEKLLDLCSVAVVHRFASPAWFAALKGHLGGADARVGDGLGEDGKRGGDNNLDEATGLFERIVDLQVGESLVFAPTAYLRVGRDGVSRKMGPTAVKMKTRMRLGEDGGMSVLADSLARGAKLS